MPNSVFKEEPAKDKGRDNLFLWTVFLLLLAALVFACWLGSFYVFGHPEQPRAYRILQRLGKLAPPARFIVTKAPPGEFLEAQRVYERYSKYTALQMQRENELLFRCYLKNYTETKKMVPYLNGKFVILRAYELQRGDLLSSGVVALTQSADFPQMLAEVVYPAPKESVGDILSLLQPGLEIRLQRTLDLSAIVQVSHAPEGRLQVTVVPLLYGSYALKNGVGTFSLEPPAALNVGAGFPLVRGEEVRSVMRESMRKKAVAKGGASDQPEPPGEIVRVDETPLPTGGASGASVAASETAGVLPKKPEGEQARSGKPPEPGSSAVLSGANNPGADQRMASNSEGAPQNAPNSSKESQGQGAASDPGKDAGKNPTNEPLPDSVPKVEAVVKAEPGVKAGPAVKSESAAKPEPPRNGNPAWMARVVTSSGTAVVVDRPLAKTDAAPGASASAADPQGAKNAKASQAQPPAAPGKSPADVQPVANTAQGSVPPKQAAKPLLMTAASSGPSVPAPVPAGAPSSASAANAGAGPAGGAAKPFIAASPQPSTTQATGTWKTYSGGKTPAGKSVTAEQATTLQGRNDGAPVYLHGRFTVTATGVNRAVLRQSNGGDGKLQPRVIVEYPAGAEPPKQGASVAREDGRGFEIREVRRTSDGQVNIYVREVSAP